MLDKKNFASFKANDFGYVIVVLAKNFPYKGFFF